MDKRDENLLRMRWQKRWKMGKGSFNLRDGRRRFADCSNLLTS